MAWANGVDSAIKGKKKLSRTTVFHTKPLHVHALFISHYTSLVNRYHVLVGIRFAGRP